MKYTLEDIEKNLTYWTRQLNEATEEEATEEVEVSNNEETPEETEEQTQFTVKDIIDFFDAQFDEAEDKEEVYSKNVAIQLDGQTLNLDDITIDGDNCVFTVSSANDSEDEFEAEEIEDDDVKKTK